MDWNEWNAQQLRLQGKRISDLEKENQELLWTNARMSANLMQMAEDLKKIGDELAQAQAENNMLRGNPWTNIGGLPWKS